MEHYDNKRFMLNCLYNCLQNHKTNLNIFTNKFYKVYYFRQEPNSNHGYLLLWYSEAFACYVFGFVVVFTILSKKKFEKGKKQKHDRYLYITHTPNSKKRKKFMLESLFVFTNRILLTPLSHMSSLSLGTNS